MNKRKQVRVLVAHADTLMTRLISDIIGLEGHTSVLAADAKEALANLDRTEFDLLIVGRLTGLELPDFIFCMQDDPATAHLPIIMMIEGTRTSQLLIPLRQPSTQTPR